MLHIKFGYFLCALIICLISTKSRSNNVSEYNHVMFMYNLGIHEESIKEANNYLIQYPLDVDVRFFLANFYYKNQQYNLAKQEISKILQQTPNYHDASLILIKIYMFNGQYKNAMNLVDTNLLFNPTNIELLTARLHIQAAIKNVKPPSLLGYEDKIIYRTNVKHKILHTKQHKKLKQIYKRKYLNEIGIYQQNYYISDVNSIWDYSTIYYGRETALGKIFGKINYANRLGYRALQGEIEAYPKLNKYLYLDIDYAFANEPNLFPNKSYGIEAFASTTKDFDFSIGGKYNVVDQIHQFYVFTGSAAKYLDHYKNTVTFRPYFFVPVRGPNSTLYTVNLRHIITDPYFYIGCMIGAGTSPDLASLTTVNFLVTQNKIINPYINFPLYNDRLIIKLGFMFQNQVFPSLNLVRNWSGGTMNLAWRF